jgi:hypothetical protein
MRQKGSPCVFIVIILFITSLTCCFIIPSQTGQQLPYTIFGYLTDSNNVTIEGATVYVNNTDDNESIMVQTDEYGRYSVALINNPLNNNISVTVHYFHHQVISTVIGSGNPFQQVDVVMNIITHMVEGKVSKPDGSGAHNFTVNVTNSATGEYNYCITNISGGYRIDLAMFLLGFSVGDGLVVTVEVLGFSGSNSSALTAASYQVIDVHLSDIEPPVIVMRQAPADGRVDESFEIEVRVSDNLQVDTVLLCYKDVNGIENVEQMLPVGIPRVYNVTVPAQMDIGTVYYHINATDGVNYARLPANPAERRNVTIYDDEDPTITHTPITTIEAGNPRDLVATVMDNVEVDTVTLWLWEIGSPTYASFPMAWNGDPDKYNATIPPQMPDVLRYYITANDTSDNADRYPAAGDISVNVVDTTAPAITHTPINSANVNDPINFTASVTDYVGVSAVWINYTDVGGAHFNESMNGWGSDNWSYLNASGQSPTGILYYKIWANDSTGNLRTRPVSGAYAVQINDAGTPIITHAPVETSEVFEQINITAQITDDVGITAVTLAYKNVSGSAVVMKTMALLSGNDLDGIYAADIPAQGELGILEYYINATDGTNNISHPALAASHSVQIVDTTEPQIDYTVANSTALVGSTIPLSIGISDNYGVDHALLYYRTVGDKTWVSLNLQTSIADPRGNGTYGATVPAQTEPGNLTFYFHAYDTSDNNATHPAALPKLNPHLIEIIDGKPPEIEYDPPANVSVNRTLTVLVNATDDQLVTEVHLHYSGTQDAGFTVSEMSKTGVHSYVGYVPAQMLSGQLDLYFTASDGQGTNQSSTYQIPVINDPPLITHANRSFAPVNEAVNIIATIEDDVHVESVEVSWRVAGTATYTTVAMTSSRFMIHEVDIGPFSSVRDLEYHITAYDAENSSVWPGPGSDALLPILDCTPPVIIHEHLVNLTINQMPIIIAVVTDDVGVDSVMVWFTNASSEDYTNAVMMPASGNQSQYVAMLGNQPLGEFSYYIEATDGSNIARYPADTDVTVEVTGPSSNYWSIILLGIIIVLMVAAAGLILLRRSKTNKRGDVTSQNGKEDA